MALCQVKACNRSVALHWLNKNVCDHHWQLHCKNLDEENARGFNLYREFNIKQPVFATMSINDIAAATTTLLKPDSDEKLPTTQDYARILPPESEETAELVKPVLPYLCGPGCEHTPEEMVTFVYSKLSINEFLKKLIR